MLTMCAVIMLIIRCSMRLQAIYGFPVHPTSMMRLQRHSESSAHFEGEQQEESLHAVESPIYKVAHEQVVCLRAVPAHFEQLHEVEKLPMDVPTCQVRAC